MSPPWIVMPSGLLSPLPEQNTPMYAPVVPLKRWIELEFCSETSRSPVGPKRSPTEHAELGNVAKTPIDAPVDPLNRNTFAVPQPVANRSPLGPNATPVGELRPLALS